MSAVNYTYTVLIFNFTIKTIRSRLLSLYQAHSVPLHTSKQPVTREQENVEGIFSEKSGLVFFSCGNNKTITGSESKRGSVGCSLLVLDQTTGQMLETRPLLCH